jgi:glucose-6-phosphate isomerase
LVLPVSKSGNTIGVLEVIFAFDGYKMVPITTEGSGCLWQIAKRRNLDYMTIPEEIGGRFSGRTPCGFLPAALIGIDIRAIDEGCVKMYERCHPKVDLDENPALKLATAIYLLSQIGYTEIFHPVYSPQLEGFIPLFVQLIHEGCGKEGKGVTIYGSLAPESQHHTNQRFFGGRKNVFGLFLRTLKFEAEDTIRVPADLADITMKDTTLKFLDGIPYSKALDFEYAGTQKDADNNQIPHGVITLDGVNETSVGEFLAFIQYLAVYLSVLFGVNPYDQPQVEASKNISFQLRRDYERIGV